MVGGVLSVRDTTHYHAFRASHAVAFVTAAPEKALAMTDGSKAGGLSANLPRPSRQD